MTHVTSKQNVHPVCRRRPANRLRFSEGMINQHAKLIFIALALVLTPVSAVIVIDSFLERNSSPARVTKNNMADGHPLLLLLDSKDQPHLFWWGYYDGLKLLYATRTQGQIFWQIDVVPVSSETHTGDLVGAFDAEGDIHLVYLLKANIIEDDPAEPRLGYLIRYSNSSWSTPQTIVGSGSFGHPQIFQLEIDPETGRKNLFFGVISFEGFFVKRLTANSSGHWEIGGQTAQLKNNIRYIGFKRINDKEVRIQYLQYTYESKQSPYYACSLVCSYHSADTLETIRTESFPLPNDTRYGAEFHDNHVGLLAGEISDNDYCSVGTMNLTFHIWDMPAEWCQISIGEGFYPSPDGFNSRTTPFARIATGEYAFVAQLRRGFNGYTGFYLIQLLADGALTRSVSHGWILWENGIENQGPIIAADSKGKLHVAWSRSNGDQDTKSEIYYDFQGSGWDMIDWSLLD